VESELIREVNCQIHQLIAELGGTPRYVCECSSFRCLTPISISYEEFAEILAEPDWYLAAPGHQIGGAELVTERESYLIFRLIPLRT
jgi:hypothetical protein